MKCEHPRNFLAKTEYDGVICRNCKLLIKCNEVCESTDPYGHFVECSYHPTNDSSLVM